MRSPFLVRRTATHITDTRAVRTVISALPEFWLVRSVEERDYGIDLLLEIFEEAAQTPEHYPTGDLILVQVKGQQKRFGQDATCYDFPRKTLLYAELFPIPFLLFFVSLDSQEVRFVWLQNYIKASLDVQRPTWRVDTDPDPVPVNIVFPLDNILAKNHQRIVGFLLKQRDRETAMQYLAAYEWLKFHLDSVVAGQPEIAQSALSDLRRLTEHKEFVERHRSVDSRIDLDTLGQHLEDIAARKGSVSKVANDLRQQIAELEVFKLWILSSEDTDQFTAEHSSLPPY